MMSSCYLVNRSFFEKGDRLGALVRKEPYSVASELTDVPNRPNIQLHIGNFLDDGVGCILIR